MNKSTNFEKVVSTELEEIVNIIEELRNTSSTNTKRAILENNKNNEGLQTILELTYNPFKKYKITEKSLKDYGNNIPSRYTNLKELTNKLANSNIDNELRMEVNSFLGETDEIIRDLYKGVLLKDLKLGINISTINKIWNDLIPTGETGINIKPMLASKFNFDKPPKGEFAITEKLDGIRCQAVVTKKGIKLYTRQGKLIEGCLNIEIQLRLLQALTQSEFVLDGELLAMDCSYEEVYKETTKRVKNLNKIKDGIEFVVFDILDIKEFESLKCTTPYFKRIERLSHYSKELFNDLYNIRMIDVLYLGDDTTRLLELLQEYRLKGAEGLMVNLLDAVYEFKRSKSILKVKVMQTVDLRIIGFEEGQGRNKGKLGALVVDYKGNQVGVGSGFTDVDREFIWNNQHMFIDKICEVQYFEETKNKDGGFSLRFPVYLHLRIDKTEPSYY